MLNNEYNKKDALLQQARCPQEENSTREAERIEKHGTWSVAIFGMINWCCRRSWQQHKEHAVENSDSLP